MKVKELKNLISDLSDESDVCFQMDSGCCGDYESMEITDTEVMGLTGKEDVDDILIVRFKALPGYRYCIQVGQTKRADKKYWEKK